METLVLTVIGKDRPGLVEALSRTVLAHGANWEASRMAHLANRFAGILQVGVPAHRAEALVGALRGLEAEGLAVTVERGAATGPAGGRPLRLELVGHDRPGIIRAVTQVLATRAVNVEDLASDVVTAPDSGGALFKLAAEIRLPAGVEPAELRRDLEAIATDLMVDLTLREPR